MSNEYKYHKYKNKYLLLKKQVGGSGTYTRMIKFYIMAELNNSNLLQRLDERRKVLLQGNLPTHNILHLTLLQFEINLDHPKALFFQKEIDDIANVIKHCYTLSFKNKHAKLKTNFW